MNTIYESKITKIQPLNLKKVVKFTLSFCNKYNVDINLRDILRWVDVTLTLKCNMVDYLLLIFTDRTATLKSLENEVYIIKFYSSLLLLYIIFRSEMILLINTKLMKIIFLSLYSFVQ